MFGAESLFMRRKGERKLKRQWMPWGLNHPVARAMRSGDSWFRAWQGQASVIWPKISRETGIPFARLTELDRGAVPTDAEVDKLSELWGCPREDITRSISDSKDY